MTVCTAALFQWNSGTLDEPQWGPAFVIAADRMLTDQGLGIEYETSRWKATIVKNTHMIFVAGDFTFLSEAINRMGRSLPEASTMPTGEIASALSAAFVAVRNDRLEKRFLSPHGLTLERLVGTDINPQLADRLQGELEKSQYDVEAIVVGIDEDSGGLYRVDEFGVVTNHVDIGFLSVGIGGIHASAQFMYEPYNHNKTHVEAIYSTFLAKKRAEVAPGVGSTTDMFRINRQGVVRIPDEIVEHMERLYRRQRTASAQRYTSAVLSIEEAERRFIAAQIAKQNAAE